MHAIVFSMKRGFLRTVRFGRKVLEPFGVTPARFDILFCLRSGSRLQSQVWRMLGLHPSTVCKMMIRLEELGLVWRNPDSEDFRQTVVKLAPLGWTTVRRVMRALVHNGAIRAFVRAAVQTQRAVDKRLIR